MPGVGRYHLIANNEMEYVCHRMKYKCRASKAAFRSEDTLRTSTAHLLFFTSEPLIDFPSHFVFSFNLFYPPTNKHAARQQNSKP